MKDFFKFVSATLLILLSGAPVCYAANVIMGDVYGDGWTLRSDTIIAEDVFIGVERINVASSLVLENNGFIDGDIHVCSGCELQIAGGGNFSGRVYSEDGAVITRVVHGDADFGPIDIVGDYNVLSDGGSDVAWDDITSVAHNAQKIILRDARIRWAESAEAYSVPVELQGLVTIDIGDAETWRNRILISNIVGDGTVVVTGAASDVLYAPMAQIMDGRLWMRAVRETDYYKILNNDVGRFLNLVREVNPYDGTIAALDAADSMDELMHIIGRANILNPIRFMAPVDTLNISVANDVLVDAGFGALPIGVRSHGTRIISSDFDMSVATVNGVARFGRGMHVGLSLYAAMSGVESDDFGDAVMYGANVCGVYDGDNLMLRLALGRTYSDFDVPYVFDAGRVASDPKGVSDYALMDAGHKFDVFDNLYVVPFAGIWWTHSLILDESASDTAARAGVDIAWRTGYEDLRYEYKARLLAQSNNVMLGQAAVGAFSVEDGVGADFSVGVISEEDTTSFQISLGLKIMF